MVTLYSGGGLSRISIAIGCILMAGGTVLALTGGGVHLGAAGGAGVGLFFGGLGWILCAWR